MNKKYTKCTYCGGELEDTYYRITDTFLIENYIGNDEDNAFCCEGCVASYVCAEEFENE